MEDKNKKILFELMELTEGKICNHCLGRKFSNIIEANGNVERGEKIREKFQLEDLKADEECDICKNLFEHIDKTLVRKVEAKIEYLNLEYETFLVGSKLESDIIERDEYLNKRLDIEVEPIKKEVNRIIGKLLEKNLKKEVDFENQDIVIMIDLKNLFKEDSKILKDGTLDNIKVRIQINPIFIEGRYNKFIRGIPQTKWPCRYCKGKGCEKCKGTGKQYPESVEELLSKVVLEKSKGYEAKFHGAGREDIDVKMLGSGRPFVLEIKEPKIRKLDLNKIEEEANLINQNKTKYNNLKFVKRNRKAEIKVSSPDTYKIYRALVKCQNEIKNEDLEKLKELNIINQRTPNRVSHRRADKVRIKEVKEIKTKYIDSHKFEMIIKTQGGLYIKELISGDEGRSQPNISDLINNKSICEELDVIEVGIR
jgi:tRNA pseudouridine synthase 10